MNEVQMTAFEMLKSFVEICEKLGLEYFLVCGSALGAEKYGGFIPWDDDIDVAMKREDYEVFLEKAPSMLPQKYALQNIHTNPAFPLLMTKMVDLNTTLIERPYVKLPIHHCIFLDIFPLDGHPKGKLESWGFECLKWIFNKVRCVAYRFGYRAFGLNRIMISYERLLKRYPCESSELICNYGNWQGRLDYSPRAEYGHGHMGEFEGLKVRLPEDFDAYLTRKYGCWREELPTEDQQSHHKFLVCDPTRPYKDYWEGESAGWK